MIIKIEDGWKQIGTGNSVEFEDESIDGNIVDELMPHFAYDLNILFKLSGTNSTDWKD